jgi:SsrA-binding protein
MMKIYAINRRAKFDYEILEKFEAGLVLKGYEVKSIKTGHISLKGAYVTMHKDELHLTNANIPLYKHARIDGYDPTASRKLLVHKKEIEYLSKKSDAQGLTLVPLSVYNNKNRIKLEFALARGKKTIDKRQNIKKREDDIAMERAMKRRLRAGN